MILGFYGILLTRLSLQIQVPQPSKHYLLTLKKYLEAFKAQNIHKHRQRNELNWR